MSNGQEKNQQDYERQKLSIQVGNYVYVSRKENPFDKSYKIKEFSRYFSILLKKSCF